ncbi:MAG TPA: FAD-dependent oxidoreductase [Pyrinomonadaceae bacterium]|nr:FAD-dependent oxidoreductase [Pyrinomonadaceae bacterium]
MQNSKTGGTWDVAVVGAGVFGAWTAYNLSQSGKRVVLIDAYGPGNSLSSSGDRSRIIRMGYGADEVYTRWAYRSLRLWQDLFASVDEPLFQRTGVLWLAAEDDPYPAKCAATLAKVGIACEGLTTSELKRRYPQFVTDDLAWAMLEPDSGALVADRAVQAVVRKAVKRGVAYRQELVCAPNNQAQQLDFILTETGERISACHYVFACGPWLPKLFPELLREKIYPTRQEVFYFDPGRSRQQLCAPALPIWLSFKDEAYGFPNLENRGVKMAIDRHGQPFDPDSGDRVATSAGLTEVRQLLARRIPALKEAPVVESRVCQYENTWNGDFLIDRHPAFENVWLVGGGSGHGFKHGPMVGAYVAARIEGIEEGIEARFSMHTKKSSQERAVF